MLYSVRGSGWYVSPDITAAQQQLERLRAQKTADYIAAMTGLGLSPEEVVTYVKEWRE
jgi:DNA-binding transcriptional regulator YhcF (GntR family)